MRVLRSQGVNIYLSKVLTPLMCSAFAVLIASGSKFSGPSVVLAVLFLVFALFMASLAVLEVSGSNVRYRRLFKWTSIEHEEISDVRIEAPFIGSFRSKGYLFPWGRLYFILDANSNLNPFGKAQFPMVALLSSKGACEDQEATPDPQQMDRIRRLKFWIAAAAAILLSALQLITPHSVLQSGFSDLIHSHPSTMIGAFRWFMYLLGTLEAGIVFSVLFLFLAILRYRRDEAWIYAFFAASGICNTFFHFVR